MYELDESSAANVIVACSESEIYAVLVLQLKVARKARVKKDMGWMTPKDLFLLLCLTCWLRCCFRFLITHATNPLRSCG